MMFHVVLAVLLGLAQSGFCCDEACECSPYPKCCPDLIAQIEARYESCEIPDVTLEYLAGSSPFNVPVSTCGLTSGLGLPSTPTAITTSYTCSQAIFDFYFGDCTNSQLTFDIVKDDCYPIFSRTDGLAVAYVIQRECDCFLSYICSTEGVQGDSQGGIECAQSCCDTSASVATLKATAEEYGLCLSQTYEGCTC